MRQSWHDVSFLHWRYEPAVVRPLVPRGLELDVYDGVRAGVSLMPDGDTMEDALRLIAAPAVLTAALIRLGSGRPAIAPEPDARHPADILHL